MESERFIKANKQTKKVDLLHWDVRRWKSILRFMQDEMLFIDRLLNSYVFEPNTPNLFERLQDYRLRLKAAEKIKAKVMQQISGHKNNLGGMLECKDEACDLGFYQRHDMLEAEVVSCVENFQNLKAEIFNYAGSILKKRKPQV